MNIARVLDEKRRWRQYKARVRRLPENYRAAVDALERYLLNFGPGDGATLVAMVEDLADLFEESAANQTPIREVVGQDPVDFAETFLRNYPKGQWIVRERDRLIAAIDQVADHGPGVSS